MDRLGAGCTSQVCRQYKGSAGTLNIIIIICSSKAAIVQYVLQYGNNAYAMQSIMMYYSLLP